MVPPGGRSAANGSSAGIQDIKMQCNMNKVGYTRVVEWHIRHEGLRKAIGEIYVIPPEDHQVHRCAELFK
jgi:hypothetical protein